MSDSPDSTTPTPKLSVHDNNIYRYEYDSRTGTLVLRTVFTAVELNEFTDVWFLEVWCHHLEGVLGNDIILDIEEWSLAHELKYYSDVFRRQENLVAYPEYDARKESIQEAVSRMNLRCWHISSSLGVEGFVIAKEMRMISREAEAPPLTPPPQSVQE